MFIKELEEDEAVEQHLWKHRQRKWPQVMRMLLKWKYKGASNGNGDGEVWIEIYSKEKIRNLGQSYTSGERY